MNKPRKRVCPYSSCKAKKCPCDEANLCQSQIVWENKMFDVWEAYHNWDIKQNYVKKVGSFMAASKINK